MLQGRTAHGHLAPLEPLLLRTRKKSGGIGFSATVHYYFLVDLIGRCCQYYDRICSEASVLHIISVHEVKWVAQSSDSFNPSRILTFLVTSECARAGFPPIREIREFRENFEDFFQSGKSGKNGFFSQNQGKKFQIRELFFPNHFQTF